ncbi:uncharacterized protein EI90DRAFT_3119495 [Cantharellus anzutake]|uniref:uncharacterized protein n=1 Tax=Cantharellus anzutake TaxID=1750568 RepID=UPI001908A2B2|nr:uncharacterized protein EI90DRAFT_3119495 [Cantharellus anzutake]KAF8337107.1 hypothetical protein EI90DRAFT_3119495 [Cantharellus anzutake]
METFLHLNLVSDIPPIKWDLADNHDSGSKTCLELVQENQEMWHKFRKAQVLVERAIDAVDAANAQLALGGMYVSKAQTQLLAWEEAEKSKEDGGHIKGTFGRVVMHDGFLRDQAERAQRKLNEQELERWKEEAKEQWKVFNNSQKAEIMSWREEKAHLATLKQKAPPKPLEV